MTVTKRKKPHVIGPVGDNVSVEQIIGAMLWDRYEETAAAAPSGRILVLLLQLTSCESDAPVRPKLKHRH